MHEVRSYEYVVIPYERLRDALLRDPAAFLARKLHASVGPMDVGVEIDIRVSGVKEEVNALGDRHTSVELIWSATRNTGLFPVMEATLTVYPLSAHETQIDLEGRYITPGGLVGDAIDAAVGKRVAAESVSRFVKEVGANLSARLVEQP